MGKGDYWHPESDLIFLSYVFTSSLVIFSCYAFSDHVSFFGLFMHLPTRTQSANHARFRLVSNFKINANKSGRTCRLELKPSAMHWRQIDTTQCAPKTLTGAIHAST